MWMSEYLDEARAEGLKQGIQQGIEQCMKQGIEKGIAQGREAVLHEMIRSMHQDGLPVERIAHIAKVTEEYVKGILK